MQVLIVLKTMHIVEIATTTIPHLRLRVFIFHTATKNNRFTNTEKNVGTHYTEAKKKNCAMHSGMTHGQPTRKKNTLNVVKKVEFVALQTTNNYIVRYCIMVMMNDLQYLSDIVGIHYGHCKEFHIWE